MSQLAPPQPENHDNEDSGAQDLTESSSDEHFSDASEGILEGAGRPRALSIPITRVERVDDEPSHGEVPGTNAYNLRTQDAVPDEIEVVPEGSRSRSASRVSEADRPVTPGGTIIPRMVVEKIDPDQPSHGEVPGTPAWELRRADADPDEVIRSPIRTRQNLEGEPTTRRSDSFPRIADEEESRRTINGHVERPPDEGTEVEESEGEGIDADDETGVQQAEDEDDFGDDFDDFEEGEEVEGEDFGDFGEPSEVMDTPEVEQRQVQQLPDHLEHLPHLDLQSLPNAEDIDAAIAPYLKEIFPDIDLDTLSQSTTLQQPDSLLSDRSSSLWSQLVAPPPLQPPNWIRSRIRRLFLVSLGVPVDLDEILPASKQKKLILPSFHLTESPRPSNNLSRIMKGNTSSTSVATNDSKGEPREKRKKKGPPERPGPPSPPKFDTNAATLVCSTTEAALTNYSDAELKAHVQKLETTLAEAQAVLEYWQRRQESALGDKEAFEGVIENLVGFVAKSKATKAKR